MGAAAPSGRKGIISGINITPMVDVVLVLLVILMVSSTYIVAQTIGVELPSASTSDGPADSPLTVVISEKGELEFNEEPVAREALASVLQKVAKPAAQLVVTADKRARHGDVIFVIDTARAVGILKFAVNVSGE